MSKILIGALVAATLGVATLAATVTTSPGSHIDVPAGTIVMRDFNFMPKSLTVKAGTTVSWKNMDEEPHTVVSNAGLFRSGALDEGDAFAYRFNKPGTYGFVCSIHPRMTGTIVVR